MNFFIVTGGLVGLLALAAYLNGRRVGVALLGAGAGSIIADMWSKTLTTQLETSGVTIVSPPLESLVGIGMIVIAGLLLLGKAGKYGSQLTRIIGALVFGVVTTTLGFNYILDALIVSPDAQQLVNFVTTNAGLIILGGLIFGLFDVFLGRRAALEKSSKAHGK